MPYMFQTVKQLTAGSLEPSALTSIIFRADLDKKCRDLPNAVKLANIHCRRGPKEGKDTGVEWKFKACIIEGSHSVGIKIKLYI